MTNHRGECRLQTFRRSRSSRLGSRRSDMFLYLIMLNLLRKLRIARDTTVNDYLCCNGVLL